MTGAGFATMTSDGAALTLGATEAVPGKDGATARGLTGTLETPDGARTEIAAITAQFDDKAQRIDLMDGVELRTSTGYVISAEGFAFATNRSWFESIGAVAATGPLGQLTAGGLRLDQKVENGPYLLVFKQGVRLLYQPLN
jgi:lipopolysaccharide export system protein LptC